MRLEIGDYDPATEQRLSDLTIKRERQDALRRESDRLRAETHRREACALSEHLGRLQLAVAAARENERQFAMRREARERAPWDFPDGPHPF